MARTPRPHALATFGLNVRKRREVLELPRLEAAERADLAPTFERGVRNASLISIARIAKALAPTLSCRLD